MKNKSHALLRIIVIAAMLVLVVAAAIECANGKSLSETAWSLLPPVIAIVLALISKEAYSSLFIGVVVGALFTTNFAPVAALDAVVNDGLIAAIADNAGIFLFLVLLGIIVALVNAAGGSAAFGRWAETHIKTHAGAQFATFILGILIFIDDYFNCLTVGSVMRPVTDSHKISRPKLAYLIDATAAPVCMIAPISSWAAAVSSTAEGLNTGMSGIEIFIRAIPYNLYSLLTFVFIIAIILMKLGREPTTTEIAQELHMEVSKVEEILKIAQEPVSLETPIGEEEDSHLGDFIQDDEASQPSEEASYTLLREQLEEVLSTLTPREEQVLRMRFGLVDGKPHTLEEVGKEFDVTRERIRQIESKALRKLRHPSRSKKLRDFLN